MYKAPKMPLVCVLALAGCGPSHDVPVASSGMSTVVYEEPPPPIAEVAPPLVDVTYVWEPGYWDWDGHRYHWVHGHYVKRPFDGARWVPAHWASVRPGWMFVPGHWRR
jgi:hypothetical protein